MRPMIRVILAGLWASESARTPYYSPESNGMAESFVKTFKRDYVKMNSLNDARTTMEQLPKWFQVKEHFFVNKQLFV
jgi:putative transposase